MKFFETQQMTGRTWRSVGYFLAEENAEEYLKDFNTRVETAPTRIKEREFLDFGDWDSFKDFLK